MHLWLLIFGALCLQESLTTSLVILKAYRAGYSPILISLAWLVVALFQIYVGYLVGIVVKKYFANSKIEKWVLKQVTRASAMIGQRGEKLSLSVISVLILPGIGALVGVWLDISLFNIIIFCLLGDLLWYGYIWVRVLSANEFASSFVEASIILLIISVVLSIAFSVFHQIRMRRLKK